jgi:hypothetical protein
MIVTFTSRSFVIRDLSHCVPQKITSNFRCGNIPEFIGARDAQVSYKIVCNALHEEGSTIAPESAGGNGG